MAKKVVPFKLEEISKREAHNKHEENKKIIFNQSAWAALKVAIEKLVQDLFVREQMSKEWADVLESARTQSLKESAQKLLLDILERIKQKLKNYPLTSLQRKTIEQKLGNLFTQVGTLLSLKAEFADNQQVIASRIDTIETDLSDIESALTARLIEPPKLEILDKKAAALSKEVDSVRAIIDDWLNRFSKASESKEKSLEDIINYIPATGTKSDFIKSLEESFGKSNLNSDLEAELLHTYKEKVDGFGLRIVDLRSQIGIRLANPYVFWDTPALAPRPSFSAGKRRGKEDDEKSLLDLFKPRGM